ncbi:MAG: mechanosensitive ion channel [Oligoflexia bacterium]|nr:mechanosensitive ion channel [Oligoflexia bacterium]
MWKALWYQIDLIITDIWAKIPGLWNWSIFKIDKNAITLGQLIIGITLLILGYYTMRQLTRHLEKFILKKLDVQESVGHAISTFVLYFSMIVLCLFTLRLLNIPITIFTVIGGALAVGIGFGSQNIMNNFISGLILILEQPVRAGDILEIDGITGEVERIGARATIIKSIDNTQIVVPNSSFLEKNILNWTLSDSVVRRRVNVGVIYGSPTRKVEELLLKAVKEHEAVLKTPKPIVFFKDFGNHALNFSVSFWVKVKNIIELKKVPSDIRFRIDELFREHNIVVAFPQQDMHFRTPLQVEVKNAHS